VSDWKVFLTWKLISGTAPYLSSTFENESFDFYDRKLSGQEEMEPRWKRVLDGMNPVLGEAIGREYVERYFDPGSKERMMALVENLRLAFRYRIQNLTWMESSTKARALDKLDSMQINVGYPNKWRDYLGLEIKDDSYVRNIMRGRGFEFYHGSYGIDQIGKPVDHDAWGFWPHEVNAGSNLQKNTVTFPAGILQPPFFNRDADDAINYGAIGAIIGHEIIHGFDDQGRRYDKGGNLTDWWSRDDEEMFNESARSLVEEYNEFEVLPGLYINGNLTLGENIADLGGATMAYHAYKLSHKGEPEKVDGFTGDQRFFMGFAQMWRQSIKDEMLRMDVLTNEHSPAKFRIDGIVYDIPEFYEAFNEVRPGDAMYRSETERPAIW
jgi:putative endopeptidase